VTAKGRQNILKKCGAVPSEGFFFSRESEGTSDAGKGGEKRGGLIFKVQMVVEKNPSQRNGILRLPVKGGQ